MKNTAISAKNEKIIFKNECHQKFYEKWIQKCRYQDVYHKALVYCLGISDTYKGDRRCLWDEIFQKSVEYVKGEVCY